ncbi:MAG: Ig-like domain-containing protein [Firmicutes bacterium]|nr:Ig-like domain-containing protein [Bacillota bacterium]
MMQRTKRISAILVVLMLLAFAVPQTIQEQFLPETAATVYAAAKPALNKTRATINIGQSIQLKVRNTKSKVKWSSSNKSVASVSAKGKVIGKKAGTAMITAKIGKKSFKCKVAVKSVLSISHSNINIENSGIVNVTFKVRGTVYYTIQDPQIVSCQWGPFVNNVAPLRITGNQNGRTYITLTNTYNRESKRINVTVNRIPDPVPNDPVPSYSDDEILARYVYTAIKGQLKFPSTLQIHSVKAATTVDAPGLDLLYGGVTPNTRVVIIEQSALNSFSQPVRSYTIGWRNSGRTYTEDEITPYKELLTDIAPLNVDIFDDLAGDYL